MQYRSTMKLFNIKYIVLTFALLFFAEGFTQITGGGGTLYFRDRDNDGFGNENDSRTSTTPLGGYVTQAGDWNDTDGTIYPGAIELCDGKDNDGNGGIDEDRPARPTVSVTKNCGNTVITRGNPPSYVTWYWQSSSSGTSTSNSAKSFTRTSNGSYYLRAKHNLNGCWSSVRSGSYTVKSVPSTPTASVSNQCGKSVLTRGNPPSGVTWYWQNSSSGTSTSNTAKTINRTSGSRYYLRARNNSSGCWSGMRTVNYAVKPVPATPSAASVSNSCGQSTLTRGYPVSGYTWYWQSSSSGTSTANSSMTITVTSGSTYYLRSRNNSTGCWSAPRWVGYSIKPAPAVPTAATVSKNCGNTVLTRGNPPSGYTWYWQSNYNWTSTSNSAKTITLTGGSTYYLRARNNSTGCWSAARTVSYSINSIPPTPSAPTVSNQCGKSTLTRTNPPSGITWYWQSSGSGTSTSNSSSTLTRTSGTTYYLRGRNNTSGCWGPAKQVTYGVIPTSTWYKDSDNDGFASSTTIACSSPGSKYTQTVLPVTDCNDDLPAINPDTVWYADTDGDGFGDPNTTQTGCVQPTGYVLDNTDQCPEVFGEQEGCPATPHQLTLSDENYVFVRAYQEPMTTPTQIQYNKDVIESVTYFDGLGRAKQQRAIKASPGEKDIVTHMEYDQYGRQAKQYLPFESDAVVGSYTTVDINTDINSYYKNTYDADFTDMVLSDINAYSESVFEASPLNRVLEQGAPGTDWKANPTSDSDHTIKFDWQTNQAAEGIIRFKVRFPNVTDTESPSLATSSTYATGDLRVTITKDENWQPGQTNPDDHTTKEYKNKQGQVVLKRTYNENVAHDTYYVYDDFGQLTYVIPPKVDASDGVSNTELAELCYQYKYDNRNRMIEKKIPGKGWEYIIYNKLDQPVYTQDALLKAQDKWLFTKYDAFGRVTYTGTTSNPNTRAGIQDFINTTEAYTQFESRQSTASTVAGTSIYYSNDATPKGIAQIYTINYYDNYDFDLAGITAPTTVFGEALTTNTKSLATGSKIRVLGTDQWITTVTYYDKKAQPIYVVSKNEYLNTTDIIETELDFVGKVKQTKATHTKGSNAAIVTMDTFTYDHMGRMTRQTQKIDNQEEEMIVANSYNALGQLTSKKVGGTSTTLSAQGTPSGAEGLQTVDYNYNVRGWLKAINNGTTANGDLFGFALDYNSGTNALYNGNISKASWQTANDNTTRSYAYTYDALNRIVTGISNDGKYNLSGVSYDKVGNILSLNRKGHLNTNATSFGNMDLLSYTYDSGNKLLQVTDTGNKIYGFKDGTNTNEDFEYDDNGNLTIDRNKQITSVLYNYMNLPTQVVFENSNSMKIDYIYDANGTKLTKTVTNGTAITTTEYSESATYKNGSLEFMNHEEGYVEPNNDGWRYVYQYRDLVGNVRLSYSDSDNDGKVDVVRNGTDVDGDGDNHHEIFQVNDYYPFGLEIEYGSNHSNSLITGTNEHQYKYQGQELNKGLGYNMYEFELRHYDPAIGRFVTTDPYEQFASPYLAMGNNPVISFDPDGGYCVDANGNQIACPEGAGDLYDDVRDSETNHIEILDEAIIDSDSNSESAESDSVEPKYAIKLMDRKVAPAIGELRGFDKFSAEVQENLPWLFGPRTSEDGRFIVDPSGNSIRFAPITGTAPGPGGSLKAVKAVKQTKLVTRFKPEQLMKWWTTSSKTLSKIPKGFKLTKKFGFQHGQKVYKYKGKYYSKDIDSHNGGAWKVFEEVNGRLKRIGTAGENLQIFKR